MKNSIALSIRAGRDDAWLQHRLTEYMKKDRTKRNSMT